MQNNCCGNGPHAEGVVKIMPLGGNGNLILCASCWQRELQYRRERNRHLGTFAKFDLPLWELAKVDAE